MSDLLTSSLAVAAVKFKWQKDDRTYDYFIPADLEIAAGDRVIVETKRGETEVEVVEIKAQSDKATATIIRKAEPASETPAETKPSDEWNF